jgi:lipopolysaccharide transport system permease protein
MQVLRELFRFRLLLYNLVARDLRVRYKRSVLGVLWAFLEPVALMMLFTVVFSAFLGVGGPSYPVFALCGVIVWGFFNTGVVHSLSAVRQNAALVKKIYFPREILPMATVLGRAVHFGLSLILLLPFLLHFQVEITASVLWLPLLMIAQLELVLGLALLLGALATFYEDVGFIVNFMFSMLFYLSPVVYPVSVVPERFQTVYMLNPVAVLLTAYRAVLLDGRAPEPWGLGYVAACSLVVLVLGLLVFRRLAWRFAESV